MLATKPKHSNSFRLVKSNAAVTFAWDLMGIINCMLLQVHAGGNVRDLLDKWLVSCLEQLLGYHYNNNNDNNICIIRHQHNIATGHHHNATPGHDFKTARRHDHHAARIFYYQP